VTDVAQKDIKPLIKEKDRADRQCEKEIVGAQMWNVHEIGVFQQIGKWHKDPNCRAVVIDNDPDTNRYRAAFPIWKTDTFEDVLKKYWKVYNWEAVGMIEQLKGVKDIQDDRGFSSGGTMKLAAVLPETLNGIIRQYFPRYYNKKGLQHLKSLIPVYFV